jgi:hypothetical protein
VIALIKGETVTVLIRTKTGTDDFNADVCTEAPVDVANVLVSPAYPRSVDYIAASNRPENTKVVFSLHFPKTFNDALDGLEIVVRGERCRVVGSPRPYTTDNVPGDWWLPVEVEAVYG